MIILGISAFSHDAAVTVLKDNKIVFASHSERYSRIKNDSELNKDIIRDALKFGKPDKIYFYENSLKKKIRQLFSGQYNEVIKPFPKTNLKLLNIESPIFYTDHHKSHAAGGYYTSNFNDAAILSLDSIGEFETFTIWEGRNNKIKKIFSQIYPHSVGLWFSAMTQRIGLIPQEHEYILMGMAALGDSNKYYHLIKNDFFSKFPNKNDASIKLKLNLHRGCKFWRKELKTKQQYYDIAAAVQKIYEELLEKIFDYMKFNINTNNLILTGGTALNCVANTKAFNYFKKVWIMPNPGDAGSSLGCILANINRKIKFDTSFLGYNIKGKYPIKKIMQELLTKKITAVAFGKAEFGPRALGNRSILADPRGNKVKDRVNKIKHREPFRPFAPVILQKDVHKYFDVPKGFSSPYMQFAVKCKYPKRYPAIVHYDNTSRVQTVTKKDNPNLYNLLYKYKNKTGCPMLLNTSLNIKGEPLVNNETDAKRWTKKYGVKICLPD